MTSNKVGLKGHPLMLDTCLIQIITKRTKIAQSKVITLLSPVSLTSNYQLQVYLQS